MQKRRQREQEDKDGNQRALMSPIMEKQHRHEPENQKEEDVRDPLRTKIVLTDKEAAQWTRRARAEARHWWSCRS